jgi:hypothetical protein
MEVRMLRYTGALENGTVIVRQEPLISPYRNLKVFKGMELEVGRDIPEKTAKYIIDMLSHSFTVEVVQLDNNAEVKHHISVFLEGYKKRLGKDAKAVLPALTIEAIFDLLGEDAMESILQAIANSAKVSTSVGELSKKLSKMGEVEDVPEEKPEAEPARSQQPSDSELGEEPLKDVDEEEKTSPKPAPKKAAKAKPPAKRVK